MTSLIAAMENLPEFAASLTEEYIKFLVPLLADKHEEVRSAALLVLNERSRLHSDVYPYWDVFVSKLSHENAYQRTVGVMLIAANIKWDKDKKFNRVFQTFMSLCNDDEFLTIRQTIQTIPMWAHYVPELLDRAVEELAHVNVRRMKERQQKLIQMDIINALIYIRGIHPTEELTHYLIEVMSGRLLNKKSVEKMEPQPT